MQTVKIDRTKSWTVEDYLLLGEANTPCQLINGELIMSPSPSPYHQRISRMLFNKLYNASITVGEVFYAPIDLYIDNKNVFQPDLVFILSKNQSIITERGIEGTPDLIIEIISPSNVFTDRNQKKVAYQKIGVNEYWIVDPANKTLEIYKHDQADQNTPTLYVAGEGEVTSSVLPNLKFDLKEIF
ncbi:MAG: Uma2 family endonuclease [Cyclobacteriaceae bacterium]|nr:MAG: Uma2 family endonuclease [Cyclobacteriaceae bacterium]